MTLPVAASVLVIGVAFQASSAPANASSIRATGSTTVTAGSSKTTAQAVITTRQATGPEVPAVYKGMMTVRNVVDLIDIRVNGYSIFVPPDAALGIFNPNRMVLDLRGRSMKLSLLGGDGLASYVVTLYFDSKRVMRKTVGDQIDGKIGTDTKYYLRELEDVPAIEPNNVDARKNHQ